MSNLSHGNPHCTLKGRCQPSYLLTGFLMLPEQVIKNSTILLVYPLHFIDVLGNLFHPNQSLNQVLVFIRVWIS